MNWDLMMDVVMSMIFFAPLLIALGVFLFMGVLVAFEGAVALGSRYPHRTVAHTAPAAAAGPIAAGLEAAIEHEVEAAKKPVEQAPAKVRGIRK